VFGNRIRLLKKITRKDNSAAVVAERGVSVDHTTIWRWIDQFAPELDRLLRHYLKPTIFQWRVDATYLRAAGELVYLYPAVDAQGATVEFYLSRTRDVHAATLFIRKAMADTQRVARLVIDVGGNSAYPTAVRELQRAGRTAAAYEAMHMLRKG